jgi:hypothetical protein
VCVGLGLCLQVLATGLAQTPDPFNARVVSLADGDTISVLRDGRPVRIHLDEAKAALPPPAQRPRKVRALADRRLQCAPGRSRAKRCAGETQAEEQGSWCR